METIDVKLSLQKVETVQALQKLESGEMVRNQGLLYFHQLEDGGMVPHVVSPQTNGGWLIKMIRQGRIYIPTDKIISENG